jgi:hypothetical protein
MPTDACQFFYECPACECRTAAEPGRLLRVLLVRFRQVPPGPGPARLLRLSANPAHFTGWSSVMVILPALSAALSGPCAGLHLGQHRGGLDLEHHRHGRHVQVLDRSVLERDLARRPRFWYSSTPCSARRPSRTRSAPTFSHRSPARCPSAATSNSCFCRCTPRTSAPCQAGATLKRSDRGFEFRARIHQ